jgi:hypothetical protein
MPHTIDEHLTDGGRRVPMACGRVRSALCIVRDYNLLAGKLPPTPCKACEKIVAMR